jgi:hypothetical protein
VDAQGIVTKAKPIFIPPSVSLPEQTIGDDRTACNYIGYLILRDNEFASKELKSPVQFNFKIISQNLKSRYKSRWKDLPLRRLSANREAGLRCYATKKIVWHLTARSDGGSLPEVQREESAST